MNFKPIYFGSTHVFCRCPRHEDKSPSLEICIEEGDYEGRCFCYSCGQAWQLTLPEVKKLRKNCHKTTVSNKSISEQYYHAFKLFSSSKNLELAKEWNVDINALGDLGIFWKDNKYWIPMWNEEELCGMQFRYPDGFKCCLEGSKLGLFLPRAIILSNHLFLTEGCSDLASLLDLGFVGVGRPNRSACNGMLIQWIEQHIYTGTKLIVMADNDVPGCEGANKLCLEWEKLHPDWDMFYILPLHGKDLRQWISLEGKDKVREDLKGFL